MPLGGQGDRYRRIDSRFLRWLKDNADTAIAR